MTVRTATDCGGSVYGIGPHQRADGGATSGGQGLAYAPRLPGGDVRPVCKALNEAFGGRGGGKPGFCQGSLACTDFADVQNFLVNYHE